MPSPSVKPNGGRTHQRRRLGRVSRLHMSCLHNNLAHLCTTMHKIQRALRFRFRPIKLNTLDKKT
jgi:hypothetical protein